MRRTQIYLDEGIHRRLSQIALAEHRSAASVIREAVLEYLSRVGKQTDGGTAIEDLVGGFPGLSPDASENIDAVLYGPASEAATSPK